ncbi:MAG: hypothetical protein AB7T27_03185 [Kiritimatiellia bacterium]
MKTKAIFTSLLIIAAASFVHADFNWGSYWYFYDSDGTTWLNNDASQTVGAFVQLIRDVDGDGIDAAIGTGTGIVGGSDDVIFWASWFGENDPTDGQFVGPESVTAGAPEDGYIFYARVWSDPVAVWSGTSSTVPAGATYWDGSQFVFDNDVPTLTYNMSSAESANVIVGTSPIPEPTVLGLGLIGLVLLRSFRRKA